MDLIAYFSISGNTKKVAEKLNSLVDADIFEIKAKKEYPTEYRSLVDVSKVEWEENQRPELAEDINIEEYDKLLFDPNKAALRNLKNPTTLLKDKESNVFIDSYKVYNDVIVWDVCWRNQKAFWIFDFSDPKTKIKVEAYGEVYNLFSQVVYNGDYDFSQISFFQIGDDKCTVRVNRTGLMELSADIVVHKKDHALLYSLELDPENADFKLITPEQD